MPKRDIHASIIPVNRHVSRKFQKKDFGIKKSLKSHNDCIVVKCPNDILAEYYISYPYHMLDPNIIVRFNVTITYCREPVWSHREDINKHNILHHFEFYGNITDDVIEIIPKPRNHVKLCNLKKTINDKNFIREMNILLTRLADPNRW